MRSLRVWLFLAFSLLLVANTGPSLAAQNPSMPRGGEISWAIGYDPKTFDPAKVDDQASELIRYLTGGVLLRLNRSTQQIEPALAESLQVSPDGRLLTFHLRPGLRFSDGSPLTSLDVVSTLQRVLAPQTGAPVAEEFLAPAKVAVEASGPLIVRVHLPERLVSVTSTFDEIAIEPAAHPSEAHITAGPFYLAEYHHGTSLRLARNPYFYKHDTNGAPLPYLASVHIDILNNRDTEEVRFARGQYALLDSVPTEGVEALNRRVPGSVHDLGASLNTEQLWFNQSPAAPLPPWEKSWFTNRAFRSAVSLAIHRADLARIAFDGHATPANGFVSPANTAWYNRTLPPAQTDLPAAMKLLAAAGFHKQGGVLLDVNGHPVRFSVLTNAGNHSRERMAALIQQDLAALGMQVNVVTLDFPALIERLMHSGDYEAALLGLSDVQPDPSSMMNIWLSSSPNHQWNPAEKSPATPWEAELDRLMHAQAATGDAKARKAAVDRAQVVVADQLPFIYLVYPNILCAASPALEGIHFTVLQPDVVSTIETARWKGTHP